MKWINVSLVAGVLALSGVLVYLGMELHSLRAKTAEFRDRTAVSQASLPTADQLPSRAPPMPQAPFGSIETLPSGSDRPAVSVISELLSTEEGRAYQQEMARHTLPMSYPDYEKILGLSAAEAEKFSILLARQMTERMMATEAARGMDSAARVELQSQLKELKQANEIERAETLGSKYSKWREYLPTVSARVQVRALQTSLGSDSLGESNVEQLVHALTAAAPSLGAGKDNPNYDNQILNVAAPYMNSRQLESYRRMLEEQRQRMLGR